MERVTQELAQILASLTTIDIDWRDDISQTAIEVIRSLPEKPSYTADDIIDLLRRDFVVGSLVIRLFLGLSKDSYEAAVSTQLEGPGGKTRFSQSPEVYANALSELGLLDAMRNEVNKAPHWSDTLIERLRSGRGSAMSGIKRGRQVEDFVEAVIRSVFGDQFDSRCNFVGKRDQTAKCDFAIPSKHLPRILIESKAYGATGSKMTDVIGDIEKIIQAKRDDTHFIFFTDGATWRQRKSDLRKIVGYQNHGDILRIHTFKTVEEFRADLSILKNELGI